MNATQSTPAGCFIGALAVLPLMLSAVAGYGLWQWWHLPLKSRHVDENFRLLIGMLAGGLFWSLAMMIWAFRVLGATDFKGYDSRDPKQSNLKW